MFFHISLALELLIQLNTHGKSIGERGKVQWLWFQVRPRLCRLPRQYSTCPPALGDTEQGGGTVYKPTGPHSSSLSHFSDLCYVPMQRNTQSSGEHPSVTASLMTVMKTAKRPNKREAERQKHPDRHVDFCRILDTQKYKDTTTNTRIHQYLLV